MTTLFRDVLAGWLAEVVRACSLGAAEQVAADVRGLRVIRAGSGATLFVPPDLTEPLRQHFEGRSLKCSVVPSDTGDEDALEFSEGVEPEQVEAALSGWDAREYGE